MTKNAGHLAAEKTFKEFIVKDVLMKVNRSKNERPYRAMNPHWRPSNTYCAYCNIRYGVVSKMETFNEDKERALELVGLEDKNRGERLYINGGDDIKNKTRELFKT